MAGITPGNPTLVTAVEDERLEFQDGGLVFVGCWWVLAVVLGWWMVAGADYLVDANILVLLFLGSFHHA